MALIDFVHKPSFFIRIVCKVITMRLRMSQMNEFISKHKKLIKDVYFGFDLLTSYRNGAGNRVRTGDLYLGKVPLYQLSYSRKCHNLALEQNGVP